MPMPGGASRAPEEQGGGTHAVYCFRACETEKGGNISETFRPKQAKLATCPYIFKREWLEGLS